MRRALSVAAVVLPLAVAAGASSGDRSAAIRVRLRISDGAVAGTGDSVRDIQEILREGDAAEGILEAPPDGDADLVLVVSHRFSSLTSGSRRNNDLSPGSPAYNVRGIVVDERRTRSVDGRGIVWRQAAVDLVRQVADYSREQEHALLRRRSDWPAVGFDFEPLTRERERELGVKGAAVVTEVVPGGPAAASGLAVGDVLVKAGGRKVERAGDLARALYEAPRGAALSLEVARAGGRRPIALPLP